MVPPPNKIAGTIESLVVTCPPKKDWGIYKGQTKTLVYKIQNTGYHSIVNFDFTAFTYIKSKEQGDLATKKNYATVGEIPDRIAPHTEVKVKVKIDIPANYSETIKYEGHTIKYPFRIARKVVGIESIEEL